MKHAQGIEQYLAEAAAWDADRARAAAASATRAWRVAVVAVALAMLLGVALVALMPLKRVDPFVVRVDNTTGIVDVVPTYVGEGTADDLVSRYFISHYVQIRERFNASSAEQDYYETAAFGSPPVNQEWIALWQKGNPRSPLERYKDGSVVRVEVRSVSFFDRGNGIRDLAQVRFGRFTRPGAGGAEQPAYFIATIQFAYGRPPTDVQQRQWNPLGFRIVDYKVDPEAPVDVLNALSHSTSSRP